MSFRSITCLVLLTVCRHGVGFTPSRKYNQPGYNAVAGRRRCDTGKTAGSYAASPFGLGDAAAASQTGRSTTTPTSVRMAAGVPSILVSTIETFDGSTIVDPVVVSNAFWTSLQWRILSVVIGQILAAAVFAALSSVAASQLSKLGDYVKENVFNQSKRDVAGAAVAQFAASAVERGKFPTVQPDFGKLLICILVDTIGTSSELLPIVGELTDVAWAPIAGLGLRSLFGSNTIFALEFIEEILPFTDIIPLATLCWVVETYYGDSNVAKALGIGIFRSGGGKVIDVEGSAVSERRLLMTDTSNPTVDRVKN